ncbi:MAG: glycosyltransferase [Alphaproteobacteria bacterium]|nr:glycosyltransferase [Alphaproteobacteria bacterium]
MSKISLVIPVYNTGKYLSETLDSVINQTFSDWEAICIDDGSTDNSLEILREYAKKDKRIKVITQKNCGVVTARNHAIKYATSQYIYPLDSDDIIVPDCLEKLYGAMMAGHGDIITCRVMYFGRETTEMVLPKPTKHNLSHDNCLVNAALFRKSDFEKIGGYDTKFNLALEDYDFWLNMVVNLGAQIYRIPEILFYYRLKDQAEARNFQHCAEHASLKQKMAQKYPAIKRQHVLDKLTWPIRKIIRFLFRIDGNRVKICKTIKIRFKRTPINLFYFNCVSNFGDLLNIDLMDKLPHYSVRQTNTKHADIVAIGSLLQDVVCKKMSVPQKISRYVHTPLIVYGSGFIYDTENRVPVRRLDVRAVRGQLSLAKLKSLKHVKLHKDLAIADPGLLAPLLTDVSHIQKKYDLGIIPHYVDKDSPLLNKINVKNAVVLDIMQPPHIFLTQLAQCKTVISSAMHGLIAADALGIPNMRMTLSDNITGGDYKYNDYYSAFGITEHAVINLRQRSFSDTDINTIKKMYQIKPEQVRQKQNELLKVFPYKTKDKICL